MTGRAMPGPAHQDRHEIRCGPRLAIRYAILSAAPGKPARLPDRLPYCAALPLLRGFALLRGHGGIEPYEPRRACLVEFSDAFP